MVKENDKVLVNSNVVPGETLIIGTVKEVHDTGEKRLLIVELEDKTLIKCLDKDVTLYESDTITISRADFTRAVEKVIDDLYHSDMGVLETAIITVSGQIVCERLSKTLFEVDND